MARNSFFDTLPPFLVNNPSKDRDLGSKPYNYKDNVEISKAVIEELSRDIKTYDNEMLTVFNINSLINEINLILSKKNNDLSNLRNIEFSLVTLLKLCIWGNELNSY